MTRRRSDAPAAGTRLLPMPKVEDRLRPIAEEIHRLHESTVWSGQTQFGRLQPHKPLTCIYVQPT